MTAETLSRRSQEVPQDDPDVIALDQEPQTAKYGVYVPRQRVLGTMAASAAAGEFLRNADGVVATGARPDAASPERPDGEDWLEEMTVRIA